MTEPFAKVHSKALFRNFGGSLLQVRQGVARYDAKHLKQNAPKERKVAEVTFAKGSTLTKKALCFCLLISMFLMSGCCRKNTPIQKPPKNFHQVSTEIYRSGQPAADEIAFLIDNVGLKSILNLRKFHSDKDEIGSLPVELYEIPLAAGSLTENDILSILTTIQNAPKPILIHCWHGSDRTGAAVASSRIIFEDWTVEDAVDELTRDDFGHHEAIYKNIPELLRKIDWKKMKDKLQTH